MRPLIRRAYEGRSYTIFNRMISGQRSRPVEDYLATWDHRSWQMWGTFTLLGLLLLLVLSPEVQQLLRNIFRYKVVRFAAWTLFVFLSIELPSRAILSINPLFDRIKGMDDSSRRLSWIKSHKDPPKGLRSYMYLTHSATRGWAIKPGVQDAIVFENKNLNTNAKGVRGKQEYSYERQPGKQRIVVLGDSFTFGDEVSDDETYSADLEKLLPKTEVLNLGVSGYVHDQMLLYWQEEGSKHHPDVVILGFVSADTDRGLHSFNAFAKPRFEWSQGKLQLTGVPVPTEAEVLARERYRLKCVDRGVMVRERFRVASGWSERKGRELSSALFDELVKSATEKGAVPDLCTCRCWRK